MAKIKVTKEMKAKYAGILPMRNDVEYTFTPESMIPLREITDEDGNTVNPEVSIKQWSNKHVIRFRQQMFKDYQALSKEDISGINKDKKKFLVEILKDVVVGWNDIFDLETGDEIEYSGEDSLKLLSEFILDEIATEVAIISGVSKR